MQAKKKQLKMRRNARKKGWKHLKMQTSTNKQQIQQKQIGKKKTNENLFIPKKKRKRGLQGVPLSPLRLFRDRSKTCCF